MSGQSTDTALERFAKALGASLGAGTFLMLCFTLMQAQDIGGGMIGGTGWSFSGGTVGGSPVVVSPPASASTALKIVGQSGHTGYYFSITPEDDPNERFFCATTGASGAMFCSLRPINTGSVNLVLDVGTSGTSAFNVTNNAKANFPQGFDVAGTITNGAQTANGPLNVSSTGVMVGSQVTSGTPITWRPPTAIATASITLPTCSASTNAGQIFYVDDSDDAFAGELCVCRADNAGTYSNVKVADNSSACVDP